ncbi:hypothetical protein CEB3_c00670 [Peptococcaceae bacterium CEB3]|nr:hypothetical protein CEB3_c00670 [Peptococcaceae bacterium CEB3]
MKKVLKPALAFLTAGALLASAVPALADANPTPNIPPAPSSTFHTVYRAGINSLREQRNQDKQIREQIKGLRQNLKEKQAHIGVPANEKVINQALKSDFQQLKADRKAKNAGAVQQDFTKIQGDLNNRLQADQTEMNILTAINNDVGGLLQARAQEKQVATQTKTVRQDIKSKIKTDRQNKDKSALQVARADMATVKSASQRVKAISLKADQQQLKAAIQAGNVTAVTQDLARLTSDLQGKVNAQQSLLTALQKVDSDL